VTVTIYPSQLNGIIQAPASKSSMQRACAAALLSKGESIIHNPGHSNDDIAALGIIQAMGAVVEFKKEELIIKSTGVNPVTNDVNCGESGLSIRMFTPVLALCEKEITITGSGSLITRPMDFFDEIFPKLGVRIKSNNGKLPMTIQGPLIPGNIEVDGSLSSQFLTGILMAFSAADAKGVTIKVNNLKSKPYIDLTLHVMKQFGFKLPENRNYGELYFDSDVHTPQSQVHKYTVEGDWSGGAFLLVAGAIAGPITVKGLDIKSTQADKAVIDAIKNASTSISINENEIIVNPGNLNAFEFDATHCPDLFPPLVALAAYCNGESKIKGVSRLTHKESNRALTLQHEFGKMGLRIELNHDIMIIHGGKKLKGATVHSCHDHRIAMALAVAAIRTEGNTVIEEAQAIKKSYPDFYSDLQKLKAVIQN